MRRASLLLIATLLLSGCIQSKEHIVINEDGSGTVEVQALMPNGTIQGIDMMFGQMIQAMSQAFGGEGQAQEAPKSIRDQIFSKDEIIKNANTAGVNIEFLSFSREDKPDGIHGHYKFKFDDLEKLTASGLVSASVEFMKDKHGNWICQTKTNPDKAQQSKAQVGELGNIKESEDFKNLDPMMQMMVMESLSNLKIEFMVTMPYSIHHLDGMFEKVDDQTAQISFSGNILEDPTLLDKLSGLTTEISKVVWSSGSAPPAKAESIAVSPKVPTKIFTPGNAAGLEKGSMAGSPKGSAKGSAQADMKGSAKGSMAGSPKGSAKGSAKQAAQGEQSEVKVKLKNGNYFQGQLVESTDDYVRVNVSGVAVTFYKDQILELE